MKLNVLLHTVKGLDPLSIPEVEIEMLHFDSRIVGTQDVFFAIKGTQTDGHQFIEAAIAQGAAAIVHEQAIPVKHEGIAYVQVSDVTEALGNAASVYYGLPSQKIKLIGITGTNGKTTVATLLYKLFGELGYRVGLLSTVENRIVEQIVPATHTTPNPIALNELLHNMVEAGCDYCFMEVSSHAIVQGRIRGLHFTGGVFTNITHDHLDFHQTFSNYIKAKKAFFDGLDKAVFALSNADDKNGSIMLQNTPAYKKLYGLKNIADFKGKVLESHFNGMLMQIEEREVWVKLVGGFNAYNVLAVYGTAILLEQDTTKVLSALSKITGADGRFETLVSPDGKIGIVDYAHTPDALSNVLTTIRQLRSGSGRQIITVIGCGGDRDKAKRPKMALVAVEYSDRVILTSDNPRTEDPAAILQDMETGIPADKKRKCFTISDRREAIRAACHVAQTHDIILIAGKGHETYQEIKGVRHPFDDKEVLIHAFNEL